MLTTTKSSKSKAVVVPSSSSSSSSWRGYRRSLLVVVPPVLRKAFKMQSHPTEETFPELPDVLVWVRALLAILYASYVGHRGDSHNLARLGGATVFQALNLLTFVPYLYCKWFLGTPAGVYDMSILFGGTPQAMCLFLLVWIYLFTAAHPQDEAALSALLMAVAADPTVAAVGDGGSAAAGPLQTGDAAAGSEF